MKTNALVVYLCSSFLLGCGVSSTSATVGSQGGTVSLGSALTLEVPKGALNDDTRITIVEVPSGRNEREFEFEPNHLILNVPAMLTVDGSNEMELAHQENETESLLSEQHHQSGKVRAELKHFGRVRLRHSGADDSATHDLSEGHRHHDGEGDDGSGGGQGGGRNDDDSGTGGGDDHGGTGGGRRDDDGGTGGGDDHGGSGGGRHDDDGGAGGGGSSGGQSCVDDDACPCGSECLSGSCSAVVTCTSNAQCVAGETCRVAKKHGDACGVMACHR